MLPPTFLSELMWQYSLVVEQAPVHVETHQAIEKSKVLENNHASVLYNLDNILTAVTSQINLKIIWD